MKKYFQFFLLLSGICLSLAWGLATKTDAYILYVFEGSDWCHNCIRLDQKVLSTVTFQEFTKEHKITIEHIDFPQRKKLDAKTIAYNAEIADKYDFQGIFPTLVLVHTESGRKKNLSYANEDVAMFMVKVEMEKTELE